MRFLPVIFILVVFLSSCSSQPYKDPYMAAVEKYMTELNKTAAQANDEISSPPKPSYLQCPDDREPLPGFGSGGEFSTMTHSQAVSARRLPTKSFADCERINTKRRKAYEAALSEYNKILLQKSEMADVLADK